MTGERSLTEGLRDFGIMHGDIGRELERWCLWAAGRIEQLELIAARVHCAVHDAPAEYVDTCERWSLFESCEFTIKEAS